MDMADAHRRRRNENRRDWQKGEMMNNKTTVDQLNARIESTMDKVMSRNSSWAAKVLQEALLAGVSDSVLAAAVAQWLPGEHLWRVVGGRVIAQGTSEPIGYPGASERVA